MDQRFQHTITLNPRVQVIYYETQDGQLGKAYATSEKRISLDEAETLLNEREIEFAELLKVKYEVINVTLAVEEFENYII